MEEIAPIAVVTGASRGIGQSIAKRLATNGFRVACVATTQEGAGKTANDLSGAGHMPFACDISDVAQVEALSKAVLETMGTPAVLVNNAGITKDTLILRMKDEDWDRVIDVNLKGSFLMIRTFARVMMKERYGRIINLSSVIGLGGGAGQANYAAAKAGLIGLTKSVAKEFGSRGITCNAVAPGFIETDMTSELPEQFRETVIKTTPIGRLGVGDDIAAAVAFFASKDSGFITGQVLTVDGGLTL